MSIIALVGPTASGKSDLAMRLARDRSALIVSADSMQVYRGMDIGTAKPTAAERAEIPHYLVDLIEPEESFSAADYQRAGRQVLADRAGERIIVVGGSGLHVRALLDPLDFPPHDPGIRKRLTALPAGVARQRLEAADPGAGELVDLANPRRVVRALEVYELTGLSPTERAATAAARAVAEYEPYLPFAGFGVDAGDGLADRVARRVASMVEAGFVDEVRALVGRLGVTARTATGYPELGAYLAGECTLEYALEQTRVATMALAKRQRTYFRRDPRLRWLPWNDDPGKRYASFAAELDRLQLWNS